MDASASPISQPITWDPLDLSDDAIPSITKGANDSGLGILPDVVNRADVARADRPASADAPWE